jgi:hypothetical protein
MLRDVSRRTAITGGTACSLLKVKDALRKSRIRMKNTASRRAAATAALPLPSRFRMGPYWTTAAAHAAQNRQMISQRGIIGDALNCVMVRGFAASL